MNPFYGGNNGMNMAQAFSMFAKNFSGGNFSPKQAVDMLVSTGRISPEQYEQLSRQANDMMRNNPGLNVFGQK